MDIARRGLNLYKPSVFNSFKASLARSNLQGMWFISNMASKGVFAWEYNDKILSNVYNGSTYHRRC